MRDEHRQDYDPGRGGWGAQAQRAEIERRREVEERYNDAQDVPGAVAGGGGDWKDVSENPLKRARSPDDEGEGGRGVWFFQSPSTVPAIDFSIVGAPCKSGGARTRCRSHVRRLCITYPRYTFR